jgi:PAS domain S-box-containing protein
MALFWCFISGFLLFFSALLLYMLRKLRTQLNEHKKSEENFHKLSLVANRTGSYFIIADKDDRIEWVNEAFSKITGYLPSEVIGKKNAELMLSDFANRKIRKEIVQTVLKNHKKYNGEIFSYTSSKTPIWLSIEITPVLNDAGKITQFVITGSDITQKKEIEDQLRISDKILNQLNALVLVANKEGAITYVNPATKSILGYEAEEIMGDAWWKLTAKSPEEEISKKKFMSDAVKGIVALPADPYENSINNKNGEICWIRWSDTKDEAGFAVGIGLDITERKNVETKLKQYSRKLLLLNEIGRSILVSQSLKNTITDVLKKVKEAYPQCVRVSIAMFDFSADKASFIYEFSPGKNKLNSNTAMPLSSFRSLAALKLNQPYINNNISELENPSQTDKINIEDGIRSYLVMPLFHENGLSGSINLESEMNNGFSQDDVELLQNISSEIAIALQQAQLKQAIREKNILLEKRNEDINASLRYAKRLQEAILPTHDYFKHLLPNSFIFYQPKDIVSGDFYWMEKQEEIVLIAAADCTGHGAPGAFMSIVGNNLLNQAVNIYHISQPSLILDFINNGLSDLLHNKVDEVSIKDGMDIVLCSFDKKNKLLEFSGANNTLWLIRKGELIIIKGDKFPVGAYLERGSKLFTNHKVELLDGDTIYMFSDGFADQFGGPKGKKFKYNQLRELLLEIQNQSMEAQKLLLNKAIEGWRAWPTDENTENYQEQVDDILVIGIKV